MAVTIFTDAEKREIYIDFLNAIPKQHLAEAYSTSARTIGRIIDEMEENRETDSAFAKYINDCLSEDDDWDDDEWGEGDEEEWFVASPITPTDIYNDLAESPLYNFVASKSMISIIRSSDGSGISITQENEGFNDAYQLLYEEGGSQEALDIVFKQYNVVEQFEVYKEDGISVDVENGRVFYEKGNIFVEFHGRLVGRLIEAVKNQDDDPQSLYNMVDFALNLLKNPNERAINELYDFLEATDVEIVSGGYVRCWKRVRGDYKDVYTGTIDNSPGEVVEVPYHKVDPDSNRTCSYGLHVCSRSYLRSYPGDRVVSVIVDPKNFVAIPSDYNFAKARVCSYFVDKDVTEEMREWM